MCSIEGNEANNVCLTFLIRSLYVMLIFGGFIDNKYMHMQKNVFSNFTPHVTFSIFSFFLTKQHFRRINDFIEYGIMCKTT